MIKILHVIIGLDVGGAELMLKRLIESHIGNEHFKHSVISLTTIGKVGVLLQNQGVNVNSLGMRSILDVPRVMWCLICFIRKNRPDVVQTWLYHADLLGGLAARIAGNKNIIWGIRTTEIDTNGSCVTWVVRKLCALLSRSVPGMIVCAADASRRTHIAIGYEAYRMVIVPNGFDLGHLVATEVQQEALRIQCGLSKTGEIIGFLGRFHPDKGQENFVRAAGLLAKKHKNVRFLMVGRNVDAKNPELIHWIETTGHADRFVLLGEREDVPVCLALMDIFCLSSRTEGFPNVVGEAMAMGVPCVATDVGDASMLVADTGIVVPKEDSVALALGLERLLELTPAARLQLGLKAKARIYENFSMERAREQFESIYKKILRKA